MGKPVPLESLPDAPATVIEDHFAKVALSPLSIDRASQLVPEEFWKPLGIHTWLSKRADEAFSKLPDTKARDIALGRLTYTFEFEAEGPVLKTVKLN